MGQDSGLKRQSHSRLRPVPETPQTPRRVTGETDGRYTQLKSSDGNFPNFHCKSLPTRSRLIDAEDFSVTKRGSMYQSSSEISRIRKIQEGRRKIDSAPSRDEFLSFDIVDSSSRPSTSGAYLFSHQSRRSEAAKSSAGTHGVRRSSKDFLDLSSRELPGEDFKLDRPRMDCTLLRNDGFLEISLEEETTEVPCRNAAPHLLDGEIGRGTEADCRHNAGVCPGENDSGDREKVPVSDTPKSVSVKMSGSHGTSPLECVQHATENSSKARSSPFKKMLNPIMKSKSVRSPSVAEKEDSSSIAEPVSRKNCVSRKSLLSDLSRTERSQASTNCQPNGESPHMVAALSPAHLRAVLKCDSKNGIPVFEFCVEGPEESISARSWESESELNRIYTFHSGGKRGSTAGRSSKDERRCSPPTVGQMHVSSYLCSEVAKDGTLNNSVNTEFVLYDIAHARRSFAAEEKTHQCTETTPPNLCTPTSGYYQQQINLIDHQQNARNNPEVSTSRPWPEEDLYPHLEIAATVIQIPFNKAKSNKLDNGLSTGTIKVVTPSGLHGLSSDNEASPSSLLDRWRYGGGCDCGGWDMACPLVVLENAYDDNWVDSVTKESKHPMELLVQGSKEELPALSMKANGKGQLLVDFHARLSALQAFSVCISRLHCSEASTAVVIEKGKHKLYSSSLKMLLEGEVMHLIEAVTAEEKRKKPEVKRDKAPPSVALDPRRPPFSPLGRV
uniref:Uncharacterized protein n=1 Tax=Avena sativa TaxID=4498 RepID=A0ACD5WII5_AVESA